MAKWPGFIGGSNTPQSLIADSERTVNLYVESTQSQAAANAAALFPTPGFTRWSTTGVTDVGARAACVANGRVFFVIGGGFYEFDVTGAGTRYGDVLQDSNPAQLVYNGIVGNQLGIASGGNVYSFNLATNTLSGPFLSGKAVMLAYAAGYGLAFDLANTRRVYFSALNDFTTWDLASFFQRSVLADPAQAMFVDTNGLVWVVGTDSFEVRQASGSATTPFTVLSGLVGRYGIAAPFAFSLTGQGIQWLARMGPEGGLGLVATRGASIPQPVGTYSVNTAFEGYRRTSTISNAELMAYFDAGHTFVNVTFPTPSATWTYDVEMQSWAERGQWNSVTGTYTLWAPRVHADCFGMHLVGDRTTGTIWEMSTTISTDIDGLGIRRLRRSPAIIEEHQRIPLDQIELLMDVGVTTSQGFDPQVMLRMSQDGGRTWGNERRASMGRIGEYRRRVYWTRLGLNPDAVAEVSWSDAAPVRVIDAWINNAERVTG